MSRCRSCEAPVYWVVTTAGRPMPVDAEDMGGWESPLMVDGGNLQPTGQRRPSKSGQAELVRLAFLRESWAEAAGGMPGGPVGGDARYRVTVEVSYGAGEGRGFRSHFQSCPDANDWRRHK